MTERELDLLRFEKCFMDFAINDDIEESDSDYYYVYDIVNGLSLISNCKSEEKGGQWEVEIFETEPNIVFHEFGEVQALINLLESRIKISKK